MFTKSYKPERTILTKEEKEALIEEWRPEPLVPDIDEDDEALNTVTDRIIDSAVGKYVSINGRNCINMASLNYLGLVGNPDIADVAVGSLRKYGCGTCGPRGFYGTLDVHIELEEKLARFMNCEEAIVYSYGFATIASAIPAYAKRGDVIFCDEGVCFAIQKGILASRSKVRYFRHNDMAHLEELLEQQDREDKKNPRKAKITRRFLVVEGLYINWGDMCPLPQLVELKNKYKVRLFIEESNSFGTLGDCGRGVTEHFNISPDEVDLFAVSLENSMASIGGFCTGKAYIVDHQRLSGLGYCFSASQPAMLVTSAIKALEILENNPDMVNKLESNAIYIHKHLSRLQGLKLVGESIAPLKHLQLLDASGDRKRVKAKLHAIVHQAEKEGLALTMANYLEQEEHTLPPPSIRVAVNCDLNQTEIDRAIEIIKNTCNSVFAS